jgi:hypothetical protein
MTIKGTDANRMPYTGSIFNIMLNRNTQAIKKNAAPNRVVPMFNVIPSAIPSISSILIRTPL